MQTKNKVTFTKKKNANQTDQQYKSNLNYLTATDKELLLLDIEMDDFFNELEEVDNLANKKFEPNILEVKKIIQFEKQEILEQKKREADQTLKPNKAIESDKADKIEIDKQSRKSMNSKTNDIQNHQNNFITNLLGGKKASVFKNLSGFDLKMGFFKALINVKNKREEENKEIEKYKKIDHIKLCMSEDTKIKAYDMMFAKSNTLDEMESSKEKIFKMMKSFKKTVEIGDLLFRLGKKFTEIIDEDESAINQNVIVCYENALKIYTNIPEEELRIGEVYKNLSLIYIKSNSNNSTALKSIESALEIFNAKIGEISYDYAECLINRGYVLESFDKFIEAKEDFFRSFEIFKKIFSEKEPNSNKIDLKNDLIEINILECFIKKEIADSYFRMAHILESLGEYEDCLQNYKTAHILYSIILEGEINKFCMNCLNNIGLIYHTQKKPDKAIEYLQRTIMIESEMENEIRLQTNQKFKLPRFLNTRIFLAKILYECEKEEECLDHLEIILFEILNGIDEQNEDDFISQTIKYDLSKFLHDKVIIKNKDSKNILLRAFLDNFKELEVYEILLNYNKQIFDINEILCEIYLKKKEIHYLMLTVKIFIICSPPLNILIEKSYNFLKSIISNMDKLKITQEVMENLDALFGEFLKFFDLEPDEEINFENNQNEEQNKLETSNMNEIQTTNANKKPNSTNNISNIEKLSKSQTNQTNIKQQITDNSDEETPIGIIINSNSQKGYELCDKYGDILIQLGTYCSSIDYFKRAVEYFSKAIYLYTKNQTEFNLRKKADLYNNLGIEYDNLMEFRLSLINFGRSLHLKKIIFGPNSMPAARVHYNMGIIHEKLENYLDAIENWNRCIEIRTASEIEDIIGIVGCCNNIGNVQMKLEHFDEALKTFGKVEDIYKTSPNNEDQHYLNTIYFIGEIHYILKNYDNAIFYFNNLEKKVLSVEEKFTLKAQGKENIEDVEDKYDMEELELFKIRGRLLLGICYSIGKNYKDALDKLNYAITNMPNDQDSMKYYSNGIYELAKCYENTGDPENALKYYNETIELTQDIWVQSDLIALKKKQNSMSIMILSKKKKN